MGEKAQLLLPALGLRRIATRVVMLRDL